VSELLVFRLFGPLASWGEIAVGQVRPSAVRPTRSALLGLLAAALGILRTDDEGHEALSAGVRLAVRIDAPGTAIVDYHTANYRRPKREILLTRRDELRVPRDQLSTVQSQRHYRCDALSTVAVAARPPGRWSLVDLRAALEEPVFPLSLGRKACPPALPLGPEIVEAGDLLEAFRAYDRRRPLPAPLGRLAARSGRHAPTVEIAWDSDLEFPAGIAGAGVRLEQRRDQPLSRVRWRFAVRREAVAHLVGPHTPQEDRDVPQSTVPG
jgi:CRISPR system Cascade subunit CasD